MMYLSQRRGYEPRRQQDTSKSAQYDGYDQLNVLFHNKPILNPCPKGKDLFWAAPHSPPFREGLGVGFLLTLQQCPLLREDVAVEGWVLALLSVAHLIDWVLYWVHHTGASIRNAGSKLSAMCKLGRASFGAAHAIDGSVVTFSCLAVCKADFVIFSDLAVDLVHRECIFYFCHCVKGFRLKIKG